MTTTVIFHNPRCSKSRAALALLEDMQIEFSIVKYLDNPPSESIIIELSAQLDLDIRDLLRTGESDYKENGFADQSLSDDEIISKLTQYPKVLQRPIVSHEGQAAIGRPPENILELFK